MNSYKPPTKELIEEILKKNPKSMSKEISAYVCKKQNRKYSMLSGSEISKIKNKLNIPINKKMSHKKTETINSNERKVPKNKRLYLSIGTIEGKIPEQGKKILSDILAIINQKTGIEVIERINPDLIEVREHSKG